MGRDVDGAFTEYVLAPENRLIAVPESVTQKASGLLQVLGTCVHAIKSVDPFPGQVAAVVGLGVTGQLLTQLLALKGVTVVGITRSEWKRQLAAESGAASVAEPARAGIVLSDLWNSWSRSWSGSGTGPSVGDQMVTIGG
jgi:D-arabinose 1-dehydrogenase-like Zn-dependent alcohol dehydrogenase